MVGLVERIDSSFVASVVVHGRVQYWECFDALDAALEWLQEQGVDEITRDV